MGVTDVTIRTSAAARDRLRALAVECDIPMGEVVNALSFARVGELLRCGAVKARAEADAAAGRASTGGAAALILAAVLASGACSTAILAPTGCDGLRESVELLTEQTKAVIVASEAGASELRAELRRQGGIQDGDGRLVELRRLLVQAERDGAAGCAS